MMLTWSFKVDLSSFDGVDWAETVQWVAKSIEGTSEETWSDWNIDDGAGSLDGVTFFDQTIVSENDNTNVITLQVQSLGRAGCYNASWSGVNNVKVTTTYHSLDSR